MLNGEPTKVVLHGPLGDMFGREHMLHISSPGEAIRALCVLRDGFRGELSRPGARYSVLLGGAALPLEGLRIGAGGRDVHIVPVVEGAKTAGATILWGAAIVGAAWGGAALLGAGPTGLGALFAGKAGMTAGMVANMGLSMAIGGVVSLIAPTPRGPAPQERGDSKPSSLFNGAVNTVAQGHPIQICYGEVEIGSAIVSTMVDYSHGPQGGGGGTHKHGLAMTMSLDTSGINPKEYIEIDVTTGPRYFS